MLVGSNDMVFTQNTVNNYLRIKNVIASSDHFYYCNSAVITGTASPLGVTPPTIYTECNFDAGTICGWSQPKDDQFDWTVHQKNTGTVQTGPSYDHTTGSSTG